MKHLAFFIASLFALQTLHAQAISLDSSFAQNGHLKTRISGGTGARTTSVIDITPDNEIVLFGNSPEKVSNLLFCTYTMNGDSVRGYHFPPAFNNNSAYQSIKALDDGSFLTTDFQIGKGLKHIYQDGTVDTTFGTNGGAPLFRMIVEDILINQNNRILLAGQTLSNSPAENAVIGAYVMAYNMDGQLDTTFGDHGKFWYHETYVEFFNKMLIQADGKILLAGCTAVHGAHPFNSLMRVLPNGIRDSSFGVDGLILEKIGGGGENFGMALQPDQKILTCGFDSDLGAAVIMRYLPNGSSDESFGINGVVVLASLRSGTEILVLPGGNMLVYGYRSTAPYNTAFVQLLPDGNLDPSFGIAGVYDNPYPGFRPPMKMKLIEGNKILATGSVHYYISGNSLDYLQVQGFLLNLNVGTVTPRNEPAVWTYPNPVNDAFEVGFTLDSPEQMQFDLYDLQGKLVQTVLGNTAFESGTHTVPVRLADGLAAGNYMLRLSMQGKPAVVVRMVKI